MRVRLLLGIFAFGFIALYLQWQTSLTISAITGSTVDIGKNGPAFSNSHATAPSQVKSATSIVHQSSSQTTSDVRDWDMEGVKLLVYVPPAVNSRTPLIILYHGFGTPKSAQELAKVLPPISDAVCIYANLPDSPSRLPQAGSDELIRRQKADYVGELLFPSMSMASSELPKIVRLATEQFKLSAQRPIGLFGFSAGGASVIYTLCDTQVPIDAAVIVNAPLNMEDAVKNFESLTGKVFEWSPKARAAAKLYHLPTRCRSIVQRNPNISLLFLNSEFDRQYPLTTTSDTIHALTKAAKETSSKGKFDCKMLKEAGHNPFETRNGGKDQVSKDQVSREVKDWFKDHLPRN
jgi:predicted esterase